MEKPSQEYKLNLNKEEAYRAFQTILEYPQEELSVIVTYWGDIEKQKQDIENLTILDLTWKALDIWKRVGDPKSKLEFKQYLQNSPLTELIKDGDVEDFLKFQPTKGVFNAENGNESFPLVYSARWRDWGVILHVMRRQDILQTLNNFNSVFEVFSNSVANLSTTLKAIGIIGMLVTSITFGPNFIPFIKEKLVDPAVEIAPSGDKALDEEVNKLFKHVQSTQSFLGDTLVIYRYQEAFTKSTTHYVLADSRSDQERIKERNRKRDHSSGFAKEMYQAHKEKRVFMLKVEEYPEPELQRKFVRKGYSQILYFPIYRDYVHLKGYLAIAIKEDPDTKNMNEEIRTFSLLLGGLGDVI